MKNPIEGVNLKNVEGIITKEDLDFLRKFEVYVKENGIRFYEPIPKGDEFHRSQALYRLFVGGNRCSKTYSGCAEDVFYALGCHPYKKIEVPNEGWVVSPTYKQQVEGSQKIILKLLPKGSIKHISRVKGETIESIWVIPDGMPANTPKEQCSKITFKSVEAGVREFAGAAKRWIHFDEEPKQEIWQECLARIGAGMRLDVWLTMTPIFEEAGRKRGMTWTHRDLWQKRDGKRIWGLNVGIEDNTYLTKEQIEEQKRKYHGNEYDIRIKGEFRLLAGSHVFDTVAIEKLSGFLKPPRITGILESGGQVKVKPIQDGYLKVWKKPVAGRGYAIGSDIGLGTGGDPSSAIVRDMSSCEQVAEVNGQIAPDIMAHVLNMLGLYYNKAWIGVEANSFGIATLNVLKALYSKLYFRYQVDGRTNKRTKKIGWWTDTKSKPILIADYGRALREGLIDVKSQDLLDECSTYIIKDDGSYNAEVGCHDDRVISDAICWQVRKQFYRLSSSARLESFTPSNRVGGY